MAARGFDNFDFANNSDWRSYYDNIFPVPSYSQLAKIKQKWYRDHIDKNYNPSNSASPNASNSNSSSSSSHQAPNSSSSHSSPSQPVSTLQLLQTSLFLLSIPAFFIGKSLHLIAAGHVAGIIHYHNMPRMSADYWRLVVADDNLHSLAFALIFLIVPSNAIWMVPAYIGVLVYVPEILVKTRYFPEGLKGYMRRCERSKVKLLQSRADAEAWLGFALVVLWVLGASHWITPIIFWQYTRMRYILNYFSKITFANIRYKGDQLFMARPMFSNVWEKVKSGCDWLCKMEANQSLANSCQVF